MTAHTVFSCKISILIASLRVVQNALKNENVT